MSSQISVRIVPAGSPMTSRRQALAAQKHLEDQGYRVDVDRRAWDKDAYWAGAPEERAQALTEALLDPDVDVVVAARGGFGCAQLVDHLDPQTLRNVDKPFVGYSDVTCIHLWLQHYTAQRHSFYGPTFGSFADPSERTLAEFSRAMQGERRALAPPASGGPALAIAEGVAQGSLTGGCLSLVVASLGTPWEIDTDGAVVFLEDVAEQPYRIHGMLTQLRQAGKWRTVQGILIGELAQCGPARFEPAFPWGTLTLEEVLERELGDLGVPVVYGYPFGHGRHMDTLRYGATCRIDKEAVTVMD